MVKEFPRDQVLPYIEGLKRVCIFQRDTGTLVQELLNCAWDERQFTRECFPGIELGELDVIELDEELWTRLDDAKYNDMQWRLDDGNIVEIPWSQWEHDLKEIAGMT